MPGEIVEVNNYYPFGLLHNYTATTQNAYQYKYNGKELQETGMYDYGARMYIPDLGRWGVIDPLAETSRGWSTYAYAYNNPVMFIDPDVMQNVSALHWKFDRNSTILGNSWFDDSYVSSGFGNNFKTMWNGGDHGGSGSRPFVQTQAFADLMDAFYNGGTGRLVNQNGTLKWWTDYDGPDPSVKGVGALGMLKLTHQSPKSDDDNWAKAALGFMALDISVPDPSDAAWPNGQHMEWLEL
ncbi:RHS repeat-associated core domain-containing protein [Chryseobacterium cucumeris]|uniref:RHS repeat-associated core domain-containing protein n=1 Tax=Chryseobacterium cucumeris TaxID=1813611 RepID=UPI003208C2AC